MAPAAPKHPSLQPAPLPPVPLYKYLSRQRGGVSDPDERTLEPDCDL